MRFSRIGVRFDSTFYPYRVRFGLLKLDPGTVCPTDADMFPMDRPGPLREGGRRAHRGPGGGGCSVASVDRLTLVELIEAQKAKLSPEALELWEDLDTSVYMSPQEEPAFIKRREVEI